MHVCVSSANVLRINQLVLYCFQNFKLTGFPILWIHHMSPLFTFIFLYMWSLRDLLLDAFWLDAATYNCIEWKNKREDPKFRLNLPRVERRGAYRNPWLAKMQVTWLSKGVRKCLSFWGTWVHVGSWLALCCVCAIVPVDYCLCVFKIGHYIDLQYS